jgi:hypothetical protein
VAGGIQVIGSVGKFRDGFDDPANEGLPRTRGRYSAAVARRSSMDGSSLAWPSPAPSQLASQMRMDLRSPSKPRGGGLEGRGGDRRVRIRWC